MKRMVFTLIAVLLVGQAFPSAELFLPVPRSGKRSVRYFADHDLKQRDPKSEYAVVMVHGVDGGCSDCTPRLREIIKGHPQHDKVFFIAPCFPIPSMLNENEKRKIVYWEEGRWQAGNDSPVADKLSPYDVLDLIFKSLNDVRLYPHLKHVLFCGYSAGGQIVSRYMAVSGLKSRKGLAVDFAAGAPSTWLFLNEKAMWHCGLANRNRYASRVSNKDIFKNIEKRFMLCFCGMADVDTKDLSVGPQAMAQGATRFERFTNFKNHIATFAKLKGSFAFVEIEGVGHSLQCWDRIGIDRLILGERGAVSANPSAWATSSDKTSGHGSGKSWEKAKPEAYGFNPRKLGEIPAFIKSRNMGTTGLMVVVGGKEIYSYGDIAEVSYVASCRKSILSMMYGKYVRNGIINLDKSMEELGIDDIGGLLPIERRATVRDLITARSGCYHAAANTGGIPEGRSYERGKTEPGTQFVYNNWDFNVAGTVFEMKTKQSIYDVFEKEFARPLLFQDWNRATHKRTGDSSKSIHLAYHFNLSTRDMARIGELMLRKGLWNGQQLIPSDWVEESLRPVSRFKNGGGYGYMWWLESDTTHAEAYQGAFAAHGMYGQRISIFPALDMVVAHKSARNKLHPTKSEDYRDLIGLILSAKE